MEYYVVVEGPTEDEAFFAELAAKDPRVEIVREEHFDGALSEAVQAIVPLTPIFVPVLITYLREKTAQAKARVLVKDGERVEMTGYTADEVERLLRSDEV